MFFSLPEKKTSLGSSNGAFFGLTPWKSIPVALWSLFVVETRAPLGASHPSEREPKTNSVRIYGGCLTQRSGSPFCSSKPAYLLGFHVLLPKNSQHVGPKAELGRDVRLAQRQLTLSNQKYKLHKAGYMGMSFGDMPLDSGGILAGLLSQQ